MIVDDESHYFQGTNPIKNCTGKTIFNFVTFPTCLSNVILSERKSEFCSGKSEKKNFNLLK